VAEAEGSPSSARRVSEKVGRDELPTAPRLSVQLIKVELRIKNLQIKLEDLKVADYSGGCPKRQVTKLPFRAIYNLTMTQAAARIMGCQVKKTMSVAQKPL